LAGPPGTRPVSGYPEARTRTLGLTEMQIKDTGGSRGAQPGCPPLILCAFVHAIL